jgi:UDP-glucose:(heptosyl)LPS alpha-1,3-glucosyltransferase
MRIALVLFNYGENRGGAERAASNLARGLLLRGHDLHVFSNSFECEDKGIRWHPVKTLKVGGLFKYSTFAKNVQSMLTGFDIVQSFTRILRCDVYRVGGGIHREYLKRVDENRGKVGRLLSKVNPKNLVTTRLEDQSFSPGAYTKIVAVSKRCKQEILANYPSVKDEDVWVVYNGVDTDIFNPANAKLRGEMRKSLGVGADDYIALFAANGWKTKGLNYAVEALPEKAKLLVAGKGRPWKAGSNVIFLGPRRDIPQLHAAADVLVHPSLHDPFPNSCLEAMASGLPVITTRVTGVAEIMTDGKDGFVLDVGSNVDLLRKRLTELQDPARRRSMGQAARQTAEQYTISRYTQSYLAVYDEVRRSRDSRKKTRRA